MVIEVWSGIISRIYTIIDAIYMCEERGEKLTIYWPIDRDCYIRMQDAFKLTCNIEVEVKNFYCFKHLKPIDIKRNFMKSIVAGVNDILILIYNEFIVTDIEKIRGKYKYFYDFTPPQQIGWSGDGYKKYGIEIYKEILETRRNNTYDIYIKAYCGIKQGKINREFKYVRFNPWLHERANKIIGENTNVVGIHVRRTDHKIAIAGSPLEKFIIEM